MLEFDANTHTYTYDGKRIPSVTQVINAIVRPFQNIPNRVLEAAASRGRAAHLALHASEKRVTLFDQLGDCYTSRVVTSWQQLKTEYNLTVIASEKPYYHKLFKFAGTIDATAVDENGDVWIIDFKTGSKKGTPAASIQLAGYELLLKQDSRDLNFKRVILYVDKVGMVEAPYFCKDSDDMRVFLGMLNSYNFMKKYGYLDEAN